MIIATQNVIKAGYYQSGFIRPGWLVDSITQHGITWFFTNAVNGGEFCNGDFWVTDAGSGVEISSITPSWDFVQNGSAVNLPIVNNGGDQWFDTRAPLLGYSATLNIATSLPYAVSVNTSIVSSIGLTTPTSNVAVDVHAVLTVLTAIPDHGAFRPPYCGTNKTIVASESDINYSALPSYARAGLEAVPDVSTISALFEKPWMEYVLGYTSRGSHAATNQPDYGREIAHRTGVGLLSLCLDYTDREKKELLIRLIQYGIDIYGSAVTGMSWPNDGGHNQGRKAVLMMAAKVLGNASMLAYCDAAVHFIFQEDQQTFYVAQSDVDDCPKTVKAPTRTCYFSGDIGLPEWGEKHTGAIGRDDNAWDVSYRINNGASQGGSIATVIAAGWETDWNWGVLFDYNRTRMIPAIYPARTGSLNGNALHSFVGSFWHTYIGALE